MPTAGPFVFPNSATRPVPDIKAIATPGRAKIAVIDDEEIVRKSLVFQLGTAGYDVAAYSSAEEFLVASVDAKQFDCIVADICLPRMNGLQLQQELERTAPQASIVFITGSGDLSLGIHAMRKGAVDFLEKPIDDEEFLKSIKRGVDLSRNRRAGVAQMVELENRSRSLTAREREVFALITDGLLNKQVGAELGTSERTVKAHRASVMNKMCADSLADLVRMAGILEIRSRPSASE
jgi:FixJ family two-component response regulator